MLIGSRRAAPELTWARGAAFQRGRNPRNHFFYREPCMRWSGRKVV